MPSKALALLRQAEWLDGARAKAWRNVLLIMSLGVVVAWCAVARGGLDPMGRPVGTDFSSFYAASKLMWAGRAADAYVPAAHQAAQAALFGHDVGDTPFFYPPPFLLICAPLAALPYLSALTAWPAVTAAAFVASARRWLDSRLGWATILAFPAVLLNLGHGQTAFLTAALFAWGGWLMKRRPLMAGAAFGLLIVKPHLALLLPLAMIVSGRWRTLASMAAVAAGLCTASVCLMGIAPWRAFLASAPLARAVLEQGLAEPGKMVSAFAAVQLLGGPPALAYAAQAASALLATFTLIWARRHGVRGSAEAALLVLAALLASPYLFDYDLMILGLPLAWLASEGLRTSFRPWEKIALLAGYVLPMANRPLTMALHAPLGPLVILGLFVLVAQRAAAASWATALAAGAIRPPRPLPCVPSGT